MAILVGRAKEGAHVSRLFSSGIMTLVILTLALACGTRSREPRRYIENGVEVVGGRSISANGNRFPKLLSLCHKRGFPQRHHKERPVLLRP